ncbi:helix-turn-helix domain-containing protein [Amycolatopsis sp. RM579]|uniref:Helix-turn-helix domain-containing protein n=2 Tax=Amycolatopsis pithecellobii TaxID=664692 RepID=A0A6N7Z148_9PSEU|nr:helix-turn-helix domain-containing protein [Amycolatopsis pithecellobii]
MWLLARRGAGRSAAQHHLVPAEGPIDLRIPLGPLPENAVVALAEDLLRAPLQPSCRELVARAEGDPALVTALLEGLRADGLIERRDGAVGPVADRLPRRLLEVVEDRLRLLPTQDRHRIAVAAVLGRGFAPGLLAGRLESSPVALLPTLETAVSLNILRSRGGIVEFSSELFWRAARELIPPAALITLGVAGQAEPEPAELPVPHQLTSIEREIVELVSEGLTNQQIGRRLSRSPHTVNYHIRKLFRKLRVESRAALAAWAQVHTGRAPSVFR